MKTKSDKARDLQAKGMRMCDIARRLKMSPQAVRRACGRKSRAEEDERRKGLPSSKRGQDNTHNVIQPFQVKHKPPIGTCVAWVVEDGKAKQCGIRAC